MDNYHFKNINLGGNKINTKNTYEFEFERQQLKKYLGTRTYNMLKSYHVIIAGGCITSLFTNKEVNDVDVYFKSKKDLSDFLYGEMQSNWVISHTDKALLFRYDNKKIQAIYFNFYQTAEEIFDAFD